MIIRRLWLIRYRLHTTIGFLVALPVVLHIGITMVLKNILVRSINEIPYELWVFPGIIMIISVVTIFPILYRDLFDLRIHRKSLMPMTLAPITKQKLVTALLVTASLESMVFVFAGMGILSILMNESLPWYGYVLTPIFALSYSGLMGNIMITLSLATDRITTFLLSILMMFIFILFGSGILVEFEFYTFPIGSILDNFPGSMILSSLRALIFYNRVDWVGIIIPIIITAVWTVVNGEFLKRKLHQ